MDAKERAIRQLYEARARRDWDTVRSLLAEEVVWHEPGEEDYSGDHRGRDAVLGLLQRLYEVTGDTFRLEPESFLCTADHAAALVRWRAERGELRVDGSEVAVYRFEGTAVAEVWFHPDGYDPEALSAVFSFD